MLNRITLQVSRVHQLPFTRASVEQGTVLLRAELLILAPVYGLFTAEWLKTRRWFNLEPDVNIHSAFHSQFRPILLLLMSAYSVGRLRWPQSTPKHDLYREADFNWGRENHQYFANNKKKKTFRMKDCFFIM